MINWEKVKAYICLKYEIFTPDEEPLDDILYCLLDMLYNVEELSWRDIANITDGYVSRTTLETKGNSLGIKSRGRGGQNHVGIIPNISEKEYQSQTNTTLSKKYKVCRETIAKIAKNRGWQAKKKGRPKVHVVPVVTVGNDLEFH